MRWRCPGGRWLLLLLSVALWAPAARGDDTPSFFGPLWSDVGQELEAMAVSPAEGALPDYALGAGFAGALVWGLHHDLDWYRAVQDHRTPLQDKVMPVATLCGDGWFEVGALAALYQFGAPRDQAVAAQAVEGQIDVAVIATVLKFAFTATRPSDDDTQRRWFTGAFNDNSFASGHSMSAFCTAAILGRAYHAEWLAYPLAALIAYSRVYNSDHWPSDTIAGAGLGTLIGFAVMALHDQAGSQEPAIRFTAEPLDNGASLVVSWRY